MGIKKIGAIALILLALLSIFREKFLWIMLIGIVLVILFFIIRIMADIYWWGRDKGKWY